MHLLTVLALRILMTLLFCVGLLRVIADGPELVLTGVILLIAYLVLSVLAGRCRSDTMIISFVVGALALAITLYTGHWSVLYDGVAFALIFTFFLPAIQFVRATVQASPEVGQSRQAFEQMKEGERTGGMFLGAHVLGSALIIGAYPILAPLVPADADLAERARAARTNCRGTSLVLYWSPFTVGMAFVLTAWPDLPLWQIVAVGFPLSWRDSIRPARCGTRGQTGPDRLWPADSATGNSDDYRNGDCQSDDTRHNPNSCYLHAPAVSWLGYLPAWRKTPSDYAQRLGRAGRSWQRSAAVLQRDDASGVLDLLLTNEIFMSLPPMLVVGVLMLLSLLAAMMTLHPIVTAAVFVPILQGFEPGLAPLVAGLVLLYAWMCGSMLALSSLSVVLAARVYNVPAKGIAYGRNLSYMAGLGVISFVLLCGLEYVLGG